MKFFRRTRSKELVEIVEADAVTLLAKGRHVFVRKGRKTIEIGSTTEYPADPKNRMYWISPPNAVWSGLEDTPEDVINMAEAMFV